MRAAEEKGSDEAEWSKAAQMFANEKLIGYKDSKAKAEECEKRKEEAAARRTAEEARAERRAELEAELPVVKTELANTKGLFSGGKKRKLQERIAAIEKELQKL